MGGEIDDRCEFCGSRAFATHLDFCPLSGLIITERSKIPRKLHLTRRRPRNSTSVTSEERTAAG